MLNRAAWTPVCRKILLAAVPRMAWKVEGLEVEVCAMCQEVVIEL